MADIAIPYQRLKTIFLDAGNTIVTMELSYLVEALEAAGIACDPVALRRAEAAARPVVSAALPTLRSTETMGTFEFYLREMLTRVSLTPAQSGETVARLAHDLAPLIDRVGRVAFWSHVLPGVPEALAGLRARGLNLTVVSNSDGTVERLLTEVGLRPFFDAVIDSRVVGYEKPDPRIFTHALETVGATAATTLHVGDLYEADVVGARAAGLHALLLDPFDDWPDVDCPRAADLTALVARL
ncbi:MAG: HAD-IA family hydrolase [Vicinamibacterales bacterium]|nr:HAD-IA family hydrolase [Vicinamibacterales bacterium]MDP6608051.1 HAD-IA family hydrolase [Vicinamibacterales bacterium]